MVRVRLHTVLKEESGVSNLDVDAFNLSELLMKLPDNVKQVINKYRGYIIILVNGRIADLETACALNHDDVVDITIPVGGGGPFN